MVPLSLAAPRPDAPAADLVGAGIPVAVLRSNAAGTVAVWILHSETALKLSPSFPFASAKT